MKRFGISLATASLLVSICGVAHGAVIEVSQTSVPQSATASLLITATGGEIVDSFQFDIQTTNGAIAADFDMTGSFLSGGNVSRLTFGGDETYPRFLYIQANSPTTTSAIDGTVGTLIIDTSSIPVGGTFTVDFFADFNETKFSRSVVGSDAIDVFPTPSGPFTISVVPEPALFGTLAAGLGLLATRRRRA